MQAPAGGMAVRRAHAPRSGDGGCRRRRPSAVEHPGSVAPPCLRASAGRVSACACVCVRVRARACGRARARGFVHTAATIFLRSVATDCHCHPSHVVTRARTAMANILPLRGPSASRHVYRPRAHGSGRPGARSHARAVQRRCCAGSRHGAPSPAQVRAVPVQMWGESRRGCGASRGRFQSAGKRKTNLPVRRAALDGATAQLTRRRTGPELPETQKGRGAEDTSHDWACRML